MTRARASRAPTTGGDVARRALVALLAPALLAACHRAPPPAPRASLAPPAVPDEDALHPGLVELAPKWRGTSFGAYLAPSAPDAWADGGVDMVFHFHAAQLADKEWRAARLDAVVVSAAFGMGSEPYANAFRDPARFGRMIDEVLAKLREDLGAGPLHLRRLAIVSFSAGFGAAGRILSQPGYFEKVDALFLLDSLHTGYTKEHVPDVRGLEPFIRFAREAARGAKLMVITHTSIRPPDYASSTESTAALLDAVGARRVEAREVNDRGMTQIYRADVGNLHAFGFRGETAKDHMEHNALVGELVATYLARRWARMALLDARQAHASGTLVPP